MTERDRFKKGSLEMLLLKILSEHDCYGYQITQIIKNVTNGIIVVREPSMYPILYRLQDKGYISSYVKRGCGRLERVYYHLEKDGLEELNQLMSVYHEVHRGIEAILNYSAIEDGVKEVNQ